MIRSWTRSVSRDASWRIRPANRSTASGSSAASSTVSASRASAPTGVFSSWLMLATKSRRTSSTRRLSVWSSASSRISPPSPTAGPSGATRTAKLVARPLNRLVMMSISPSRGMPSRRTWRARASSSPTDEPVAVHEAELARGCARAEHLVVAVEHDSRRQQHREHRVDAGGQLAVQRLACVWHVRRHDRLHPHLHGLMLCGPPRPAHCRAPLPAAIREVFTTATGSVHVDCAR